SAREPGEGLGDGQHGRVGDPGNDGDEPRAGQPRQAHLGAPVERLVDLRVDAGLEVLLKILQLVLDPAEGFIVQVYVDLELKTAHASSSTLHLTPEAVHGAQCASAVQVGGEAHGVQSGAGLDAS